MDIKLNTVYEITFQYPNESQINRITGKVNAKYKGFHETKSGWPMDGWTRIGNKTILEKHIKEIKEI